MKAATFAVAASVAVFVGAGALPAAASTVPPAIPNSWYMDTIAASAYDNLGCRQATAVNNVGSDTNLIIAFIYGSPRYFQLADGSWRYGATAYGSSNVTVGQISTAVKNFVNGYARCLVRRTSRLAVTFGPTNQEGATMNPVGVGSGQAWASGVKSVDDYIYNNGYSSFLSTGGAIDMELEYNNPTNSKGFVDGFNSPTFEPLWNFGDSTGCPQLSSDSQDCGGKGYIWTQSDVHYVTWGAAPARSLPQNYNTVGTTSNQRQYLRYYWGDYYAGTLTQSAACVQTNQGLGCSGANNSPQTGFTMLDNKLNSTSQTAETLTYATDMKWCYSNGGNCA